MFTTTEKLMGAGSGILLAVSAAWENARRKDSASVREKARKSFSPSR